jgi:heme-binding NEAT domain protein
VGITGEEQEQAYCKSAYKAMRFAFLLKKQTGFYIDDASLKALSEEIAKQKAEAAAKAEQPAEQEAQPEAEQPKAEEPKKKQRKPRTKKVQQPAAESAELIAFV